MTFNPATYLCVVCVYLQGFEEFLKYLEFLHQWLHKNIGCMFMAIDSWLFW